MKASAADRETRTAKTTPVIRFNSSAEKVASGAMIFGERFEGMTRGRAAWAFYQADRVHLNRYDRPVFGLRYFERNGMPAAVELDTLGPSDDARLLVAEGRYPDMLRFSASDKEVIGEVVTRLRGIPEVSPLPMQDGWNRPNHTGFLCYSLMLDPAEDGDVDRTRLAEIALGARYGVF
jgi:hypothetical protein